MNKNIIGLLGIVTGLLVGGLLVFFLNKEKIAYINTSVLMEKSKAIQSIKKDMQKDIDLAKGNLDTLQLEFEGALKKYEKDISTMSSKERQMGQELLNHKKMELSRYQQAMESTLSKQEQKMTGEALKAINTYITDYGKQHHYKIIFATVNGNIAYADESIDITNTIVDGINEKIK